MRKRPVKPRNGVIAALDVGSSKICCFVARIDSGGRPRIIGIGHQVSQGVRAGGISDMEAAETAIRGTIHAAEQMAKETLQGVILNVSRGPFHSSTVALEVPIAGHEVGDADLKRVMDHARTQAPPGDAVTLHGIPIGYTIDGNRGIRDPRGMAGETLGVNVHLLSAPAGPVRNLSTCVARCHLDIEAAVVSPYASGLATLVEDEMDLGVTVIDMGGGTTSVAVFFDGAMIFADVVPVGGGHVTSDIARGLSTPLAHAERMKTLYGNAVATAVEAREIIDVPLVGEDEHAAANHVPKSILTGIIQPRLEETFELVRSRLEASGADRMAGRRVVLTGGASQLQGIRELAALILDKQVRIGRPMRLSGLADAAGGPAFATCAGLLGYAMQQSVRIPAEAGAARQESGGIWSRIGWWLREAF